MSGVYIHIPFCARKCAYCDFASWPGRQADWQRYVRAVEEEIRAVGGGPAETVFFGGGTPSLLPAEWLCGLLDAVRETFALAADVEITLEANPGTISPDSLALYRRAGVNRISFGAQSANDALLRAIGRIHTWAQVEEAVRMAQDAGLENINLDLMYGLPGQTVQDVKTALLRAMALGVRHISCYNLIVEPGTPLARGVERGEIRLPTRCARAALSAMRFPIMHCPAGNAATTSTIGCAGTILALAARRIRWWLACATQIRIRWMSICGGHGKRIGKR